MTESTETPEPTATDADAAKGDADGASDGRARAIRRLRLAVILIMIGIATEIIALMAFSPATFMLFVGLGAPAMVVGVLIEARDLIGRLRSQSSRASS